MEKKQINMKIFLVLIILGMISCKNIEHLQGSWLGEYKNSNIELVFKDDSLTINYLATGEKLTKKYLVEGNKMILYPEIKDTCNIVKLDKNNLILRPINKLQPDVNVIFLIDFKKEK